MTTIYLDSTATTPVSKEVLSAMLPVMTENYGNNSSRHHVGRKASALVENARDTIAKAINCQSSEIYFTSGGTEANNWAIRGIAHANLRKGNHIITSKIEHHSVLEACHQLEREGFEVTYLDVDEHGLINFPQLLHSIRPTTTLISIVGANNEIGTVQYIKAIAQTAHEKGIIFHVDAVQLFAHMDIDVEELGIDAMSISAHKLYGPKGVGALYVNNDIMFDNLLYGGQQERAKRPGTVNVAGVVGFGKAVEVLGRDLHTNEYKIRKLRDYFKAQLVHDIEDIAFNGHQSQCLNSIVSVSFAGVDGEALMTMLDLNGICVSTGSACSSSSHLDSHVIMALGRENHLVKSTIRFSFGIYNTFEEIDATITALVEFVNKLRAISPTYKKGVLCTTKK
ncbi:MAG: cysteine desulfurase family protein [Clostridia bacterium]